MGIVVTILLICGLIFFFGGSVGIIRFPDFYSRLHPAGKLDTAGHFLMMSAMALFSLQDLSLQSIITGVKISARARDKLGAILALGFISIIFWHVFINIGMVIGIMPVVGVTLPLMSYGGSSLVTTLIAIGLLQNIAIRRFMF